GKKVKVVLNIDKNTKFLKDEAAALMYICQSLDEDDQSLVDEYEAAHDHWAYLKLKYSRTHAFTANMYMTKIQTFTLDDGSTIIGAWDKLKGYRRKLGAADPEAKGAYTDRSLLLVLTRALPKDYETMIDSLDIQTELTVDEKIKHLEAKEMRLKEGIDQERAHVAFRKGGKYVPPQRRGSQDSRSECERHCERYECHLCGQSGHFLRHCPDLEKARLIIRGLNEKKKEFHPSRLSSKSRSSSKQPTSEQRPPAKKSSSGKKSRGHVANDDDEGYEDTAFAGAIANEAEPVN